MSSPIANQSYSNYGSYSNSSSGSTYTGGRGTSSGGAMLREWATTSDRTENFLVTGQRTGRGVITTIDTTILKFEKDFNGRR
ncbi:hypothetical protein NW768_004387 [Fusarium equiseti]|uniref:Uncharacterized protein n=1 Tax=Fusarium equiseti TaxID=61235 RepID=A0ABQ8RG56_FUSEQ|nr:hypothetical protein NW768_004387 [Fusarium equiseti]